MEEDKENQQVKIGYLLESPIARQTEARTWKRSRASIFMILKVY